MKSDKLRGIIDDLYIYARDEDFITQKDLIELSADLRQRFMRNRTKDKQTILRDPNKTMEIHDFKKIYPGVILPKSIHNITTS